MSARLQNKFKIVKAETRLTVSDVPARRFKTDGAWAFTVTEGKIIGTTKSNGGTVPYSISALDVAMEIIAQANRQDAETIRKLACVRLDELAA